MFFSKKSIFIENLERATGASFCRTELLWCSFDRKLSILCVWNKIKSWSWSEIWYKTPVIWVKMRKTLMYRDFVGQIDDCWNYKRLRVPSKSISKNHKFGFLNYKYDKVFSKKISSAYDIYKCLSHQKPGGVFLYPPSNEMPEWR